MRSVVVYESMYGNTRRIAERIGEGLRILGDVKVVPAGPIATDLVATARLVVVGGPTHVHGLSSARSRKVALDTAATSKLTVEPDASRFGLREWFEQIGSVAGTAAAAFDTRVDFNPVLTGRASRGIGRHLRHRGYKLIMPPESCLVDKTNHLIDGELDRAGAWSSDLAAMFSRYEQRHAA